MDICGDLMEGMGGDTSKLGETAGEVGAPGGDTEQSFSLSRKSTGLNRIMGSYNTIHQCYFDRSSYVKKYVFSYIPTKIMFSLS